MALTCTFDSLTLGGGVANPNYSYQWATSPGGHILSGGAGTQIVVDEPGIYTLTVFNPSNGCSTIDSVTVIRDVTPPQAIIAPPAMLNCQTQLTTLSTVGSSSGPMFYYNWTTTGGNILSGAFGPAPVVDQPGNYQLLISNFINGCTATAVATVSQDTTLPIAAIAPPAQLNCAVDMFGLVGSAANAGPNPQYDWQTADGNILAGAKTLSPVINAPGIYQLTVTNPTNQCWASAGVMVTRDTDPPLAAIDSAASLTCIVNEVRLFSTGSSAGPLFSYQWTAQNGGSILSGADTPVPTVNAAGNYLLTVTNTHNLCTATALATVARDTLAPEANAGSPVMLNCNAPEQRLDGSGSSAGAWFNYFWDTPNGLILSGENTLTPLIGTPGQYTLTVINLRNGCTNSASVSADQDVDTPQAEVATPDVLTCLITELTLQGMDKDSSGNNTYQWLTANGQITAGAATLASTVTAPGDYQLIVTNTLNGCTAEAIVAVYQSIEPPTVLTGDTDTLTCATKQVTLKTIATGAGGKNVLYAWSTQNGTIVSGADGPEPVVSVSGWYRVTVTDSYNGCTGTAQFFVPVDVQLPQASVAKPGPLTCAVKEVTLDGSGSAQGGRFSYTWNGPSIISGAGTLIPAVNQSGQYRLEVFDVINGCSSSAVASVSQDTIPPLAEAGPAFELNCTVIEGYLEAQGSSSGPNITYLWSTTDGNILSDPSGSSLLVNATGVYFLQVTDTKNGCTAVDLTIVSENTNYPTAIRMFTDPPGCDGKLGMVRVEEIQGGTGPYVFSINNGNTFSTSSQFGQLHPGQYNLVVQDANGCEYVDTLVFPELPGLNVQLGPDIDLDFGGSATLTAYIDVPYSEIDTVIWSPVEHLTLTNNLFKVIIDPYADIVYTVTVINKYGCEDRSSIVIRIGDPRLWAPNAFSPNKEDGKNDRFLLFAADNTVDRINTFQVFDRWGNVVFYKKDIQPNDEKQGWDGYCRGKLVNPGVFVWYAEVLLLNGQKVLMKGDVTIVD
ncbi:MAG: gliding motility-associated C-terminal domain-containing protein [Thermoanaerobaculia bacterium]|nr:gliding motility-associated C-terminal domain-containing protein [Thermoanaerobaculia bacterium]